MRRYDLLRCSLLIFCYSRWSWHGLAAWAGGTLQVDPCERICGWPRRWLLIVLAPRLQYSAAFESFLIGGLKGPSNFLCNRGATSMWKSNTIRGAAVNPL